MHTPDMRAYVTHAIWYTRDIREVEWVEERFPGEEHGVGGGGGKVAEGYHSSP